MKYPKSCKPKPSGDQSPKTLALSSRRCCLNQDNILGAYIRKCREGLDISLRGLARYVGVSATYISELETGKMGHRVKKKTLEKIARILEVEPSYLILLAGKLPDGFREIIEGIGKRNVKQW